ncbi:MAG: hypothetical protein AB7G11_00855 [Phycisphaerales bacterium]
MRLLIGIIGIAALLAGMGTLAWQGLELSRELAPDMEYWREDGSPKEWSTRVSSPAPDEVFKVDQSMLSPGPAPHVRVYQPTGDAPPASPAPGLIVVPDNTRSGKTGGAPASPRASATRSRTSTAAQVYDLQRRTGYTRALDRTWYVSPKFAFTSGSRKNRTDGDSRRTRVRTTTR